jgi:hypothetical protein
MARNEVSLLLSLYAGAVAVAVGTAVTCRPPHRSVRAELPHTAPALGT